MAGLSQLWLLLLLALLLAGSVDSHVLDSETLDQDAEVHENSTPSRLLLSFPSSTVSLSGGAKFEVVAATELGPVPHADVFLLRASRIGGNKHHILTNQKLHSKGDGVYTLHFPRKDADIGRYTLEFEVKLDSHLRGRYIVPPPVATEVTVTGIISVSNAQLAVVDSDTGSPEFESSLDFTTKNAVTLSANHLQKLRLKLQLLSPTGTPFYPQQAVFKLKHERNEEHSFLVQPKGPLLQLELDFLGLVEKLNYLSGTYTLELVVGDAFIENSFLWNLGMLDLDLPGAPEGTARAIPPAAEHIARYELKPEIAHIFRAPEKRPPVQLSYFFFVLTLLPLGGLLIGLLSLGANLKAFPSASLPQLGALGFHAGIFLILGLYTLFWLKLDLFATLKWLGILGLFTIVTGHITLSHLADNANKVKTS